MPAKHLPFGFQKSAAFEEFVEKGLTDSSLNVVAFYLPQFHPTSENNIHWGAGFTEWNNVTRATVEFTDHYQPRVPRDLGYYDLRIKEIQKAQARAAQAAGVGAFCYYYYWFDGDRPLMLPIDNHVDDDGISLPFCLCFANENWTKKWDGLDGEVIFKQTYGKEFAHRFWKDIEIYIKSPKYLRDKSGRPYLLVYRPSLIPNFQQVAETWEDLALKAGFPGLKIIASSAFEDIENPTAGVSSMYEFPPLNNYIYSQFGKNSPMQYVHGKLTDSKTRVHDYRQFIIGERLLKSSPSSLSPGVMPDWDNVARRPYRGDAFIHSTPAVFEEWVSRAARRALSSTEKLLFVNAWNEWAEGAYLDPDQRYGWAYLNALSRGIKKSQTEAEVKNKPIAIIIHAFYQDVFDEYVLLIKERIEFDFYLIVTTDDAKKISAPSIPKMMGFEVIETANRGRDIRPFLLALSESKLDFDIGLKLHTKRSPHRVDGDVWRKLLVDDLMPVSGISEIVELFRSDPSVGFISPDNHWARIGEHLGSNMDDMISMCAHVGYGFSHKDLDVGRFIAGSMFWFRRTALNVCRSPDLLDSFVDEEGQLDGTPAHALERLFSLFGEKAGYITIEKNLVKILLKEIRQDAYSISFRLKLFSDQIVSQSVERIALSRVDNGTAALQRNASPTQPGLIPLEQDTVLRKMYRKVMPAYFRIYVRRKLNMPL